MSKIKVNGKEQEIETPILLIDLIKINKVEQPDMVSVQLNEKFVERENYETTQINEGDEIEFLYFMGGGSRALIYI
jgi:sulfur carrier protein